MAKNKWTYIREILNKYQYIKQGQLESVISHSKMFSCMAHDYRYHKMGNPIERDNMPCQSSIILQKHQHLIAIIFEAQILPLHISKKKWSSDRLVTCPLCFCQYWTSLKLGLFSFAMLSLFPHSTPQRLLTLLCYRHHSGTSPHQTEVCWIVQHPHLHYLKYLVLSTTPS